ncbi:MAG: response regulator [Candidatus Accumulibacter sp.]|jgi:putative two-component system response regulator|nr:response regulator [Accumulibacter sp.]
MDKQTVVVVDDNIANLTIVRSLLKGRYEVFPIPSASILFEYLNKAVPDLILLDVEMPEMDGYEVIEKLKSDSRFDDVPVIFLTSHEDEASELEGLSLGAVDYVSKPFSPPLLLKRIENHLLIGSQKKKLENYNKNLEVMVEEKTEHIFRMQERLLTILAEMVEFRDSVTGEHIDRTQKYLKILIDRMLELGVYKEEVGGWNTAFLIPSAQLHDIGKVSISDAILNKPGKLTREEFEIIKTHVAIGVQIIERIERETKKDYFLSYAKNFAGYHHEKWDGSGYPNGLSGADIPLQGRIMALVDVYDALVSARPYKEPMPFDMAKSIIVEESGKHFDPAIVDVFSGISGRFEEVAMASRQTSGQ